MDKYKMKEIRDFRYDPLSGDTTGFSKSGSFWTVSEGNAHDVLLKIPDDQFDCAITSPPYFWLRDYETEGQIGQENSVADYVEAIASVMDEVYRVLKLSGCLFLNIGETYYSGKGKSHGIDKKSGKRRFGLRAVDKSGGLGIGLKPKTLIGIPWRVALEMIGRGWVLRSTIIWHQKYSLPESVKDRPRRSYEYVFMFVKNRKYYFNRDALEKEGQQDMWTIVARPKSVNGLNTAPFPDEIVQRCLSIGCPPYGSVLDPFAGSGTTIRVAIQTGRSATGIELNPEFCKYMIKQLSKL